MTNLHVKIPRMRLPLTPKEQAEWDRFCKLCEAAGDEETAIAILKMELQSLARKGNPAAQRFMEKLAAADYVPRKPNEAPKQPPRKKRYVVKVTG
jgi:hypothetical protein